MKKIVLIILILTLGVNAKAQLKSPLSFYNLGVEKMASADLTEEIVESAIIDFEMAIEQDSTYGDAYLALGLTLYRKSLPVLENTRNNKLNIYERSSSLLTLLEVWEESTEALEKAKIYGKESALSVKLSIIMYKVLGTNDKYLKMKKENPGLNSGYEINKT